jgi:hypothetical protein
MENLVDHGKISENILYKSCVRIFGEDLVFLSPNVESEVGKKLELTDVLIILDKCLITIQSKSLALNASEIDDIKMGRIVSKYEDAKRQINRTLNAYNRKQKVVLNTCFNKVLQLPWSNIKEIISIVTINLNDEEYSDSELRFQFPLKVEKHKNVDVHTFILRDFYNIISEFNTGADFYRYLHERKFLSTKIIQNYTNELDIVALYVSQYEILKEVHEKNIDIIQIAPGIWENYRSKNKRDIEKRDKKKYAISIIEIILKELRTSIDYTIESTGIDIQDMTEKYFHLIGIFSMISRVEAVYITEIFISKLESTSTEFFRYFIFPVKEYAIFFLIVNEPNRTIRQQKLLAFIGQAAKYISTHKKYNTIREIIGVATEGKQIPGRSIDIVDISINEALTYVDPKVDIELFRDVDKGRVDEWTM